MTTSNAAPFNLGERAGQKNGGGNGTVADIRQRPDGAWIVGIGGGGNALRYYLAEDLVLTNWLGQPVVSETGTDGMPAGGVAL